MKNALKTTQPSYSSIFSLVSQLHRRAYAFQEGVSPLKLSPHDFTLLHAFAGFYGKVKYKHVSHLIKRKFTPFDNSIEENCDAAIDQGRDLKNNRSCVDPATGYIRW